jgi:hypothetical protein
LANPYAQAAALAVRNNPRVLSSKASVIREAAAALVGLLGAEAASATIAKAPYLLASKASTLNETMVALQDTLGRDAARAQVTQPSVSVSVLRSILRVE